MDISSHTCVSDRKLKPADITLKATDPIILVQSFKMAARHCPTFFKQEFFHRTLTFLLQKYKWPMQSDFVRINFNVLEARS